ncbi:MAG: glucose-1-phosphate thymidylyltransferase [Caldimicrobium sp.]
MVWQAVAKDFFESLTDEFIGPLLESQPPWEVLKILKDYLYSVLPEIPKLILMEKPLPEAFFVTVEGEIIPLRELKKEKDEFYFKGKKLKGAILNADVYIKGRRFYFGEGVVVEPFAYLEEPCYFSNNTQVRHAAYVRGSVYTGKGAIIGHTTEVKNSIFLQRAKAAHFAYVGDSILGAEVNLGAGTKLANLKFLRNEIILEINGKKINTGLKKFGAILGDRVQTGCNVVLLPGTLIGKDSFIYPGITPPSGFYPPRTKIKN